MQCTKNLNLMSFKAPKQNSSHKGLINICCNNKIHNIFHNEKTREKENYNLP